MRAIVVSIILLILSYWAIKPLFSEGWFSMHDDTQVGRVVAMGRALRNGQFPVRWVSDLGYGYGYPFFNFYGPLPYYAGGMLYSLGVSGLTATKAVFLIGIVGAAFSMFFFARYLFGNLAGLIAGVAFLYAPYHAAQIYIRGAVGEFWLLMFLPVIALGLAKRNVVLGGIGLAGAILSHTILGYVTTLALGVGISLYALARRNEARPFFAMVVLGLGLSMFFWLPAALEMRYTNVFSQIGPTAFWGDHFVCISQLWYSDWGFGGSAPGCVDGLSFKLGKLHIVLAVLGIFALWKRHRPKTLMVIALVGAMSVFLLTDWSSRFWHFIPQASFIQYPWRMLTFTIFAVSVFVGASLLLLRRTWVRILATCAIVFLIVIYNGKLFMPQFGYPREPQEFESDQELKFRVSAISDEYLPPDVPRPAQFSEVPKTTIKPPIRGGVQTEIDTEVYTKALITLDDPELISINRAHFPGWRYFIEGKEVFPDLKRGLPTIELPKGKYVFESRFTDTPVRSIGNVVSLISLLVVLSLVSRYEKKAHT